MSSYKVITTKNFNLQARDFIASTCPERLLLWEICLASSYWSQNIREFSMPWPVHHETCSMLSGDAGCIGCMIEYVWQFWQFVFMDSMSGLVLLTATKN